MVLVICSTQITGANKIIFTFNQITMSAVSDKLWIDSLRLILDLTQLLKFNLQDFKELETNKELPPAKSLRPDCAQLIQALNGFLLRCNSKTTNFAELTRIMQRDELHDLSMHIEVVYQISDLAELTNALRVDIERLKAEKEKEEKKP